MDAIIVAIMNEVFCLWGESSKPTETTPVKTKPPITSHPQSV